MTAPVTLFTGRPGAGKTAQLVAEIVRLEHAEPGRPIFAMGITGLKEGLAADLTLEQLHKWWELPPGSIIALDECQEEHLMPRDRGTPAEWVQRISKVRHFGISFLLTTQDPANMSAYVRRLVGRHVHTVNKFQTGVLQRFEWGRCMDDPDSRSSRKQAIETKGLLPKEVFDLYKSSQLHTVKPRIPKKFYWFVFLVIASIVLLCAIPFVFKHMHNVAVGSVAGGVQPGQASPSAQLSNADQALRRQDYVKWMTPRVAGVPWTAPAFDGQQVKAVPRLACMQLETGECNCVTEQGTRMEVPLATCKAIVRDGLYNPFVADPDASERKQGGQARPDQPQAPVGPARPADGVVMGGTYGERATAKPYAPPETTHEVDPGYKAPTPHG